MLRPRPVSAPRPPAAVAEFPPKLACLFRPARYKVAYGGRGATKSWSFARALLLLGGKGAPLRIICCREIQKSIRESVYLLLVDQIKALGLGSFYQALATEIRGKNGTTFTFHGLRHNIDNIKSLEGADIVWVEEAQTVSDDSWTKLIPTVRKSGSEIWVSFNPELESDPTYQRFVLHPPPNAVVVKLTYRDNPWFSLELDAERKHLQEQDPDAYLHVWEGATIRHLEGAVYGTELRAAEAEGRITRVPYEPSKGVSVYTDLGWGDMTSLWFAQRVGMERRVLHSYQNRHKLWQHYLQYIQSRGYVIECVYLPHDAESGSIAGLSVAVQTRNSGMTCQVIPRTDNAVLLGINAVRNLFPSCYFDAEGCADGLQALRHYRYEVDAHGNYGKMPAHDDASHYADALRYLATAEVSKRNQPKPQAILQALRGEAKLFRPDLSNSWMGR